MTVEGYPADVPAENDDSGPANPDGLAYSAASSESTCCRRTALNTCVFASQGTNIGTPRGSV